MNDVTEGRGSLGRVMKKLLTLCALATLCGCAIDQAAQKQEATLDRIKQELERAAASRPVNPNAVSEALLPPLVVEMPRAELAPPDTRFDLNVNNAPSNQVFMAIVSGTRYSMIVHPSIKDPISLNLKDVTVLEAMDAIRDLYGYEYRVQGNRITVQPVSMQTRVFQVNYLQGQRRGQSDVRVSSGSITDSPTAGVVPGVPSVAPVPGAAMTGAPTSRLTESTRITTSTQVDFWGDVNRAITAIVGATEGRSVIVNPQSGVIVVRALPAELRSVESFLKSMQLIVERQVMLEAKIVEVRLREGYEAGVNWAAFRDGSTRGAAGVIRPGSTLGTTGTLTTPTARAPDGTPLGASSLSTTLGLAGEAGSMILGAGAPGGIFGLALQTSNFAALLAFLETQGGINVLSSPRVATINNQKAVLKVGTDEFFVTNITTTSTTSAAGTTTAPTITVQPFFSGIALDVTPQIDEANNIILHVHPSVSSVIEKRKVIDLGNLGTFTLPLASSDVNETDTVVRVQDNNIVAIGGLMREQSETNRSQLPGVGDVPGVGALFRQRAGSTTKSELVILIKPTIITSERSWQQDLSDTRDRVRAMDPRPAAAPPR